MYGEIYLKPVADSGAVAACNRPKPAAEEPAGPDAIAFHSEVAAPGAAASAVSEDRECVEPQAESVKLEVAEADEPEEAAGATGDAPIGSVAELPDELIRLLEGWSGVCASVAGDDAPRTAASADAILPAVDGLVERSPASSAAVPAPDGADIAPPRDAVDEPATPDVAGEAEVLPHTTRSLTARSAAGLSNSASEPGNQSGLLQSAASDSGSARADSLALGGAPAALAEARMSASEMVWRPAQTHAHAPSVIRQMADAVVTTRDSGVEIALSPEELGRVRLIVTGAERAHHVTVWVERPEVMDLVRRNVGLLAEQFGEAGLENASFEFREDRGSRGEPGERSGSTPHQREDLPDMTALNARIAVNLPGNPLSGDRRLDIRL